MSSHFTAAVTDDEKSQSKFILTVKKVGSTIIAIHLFPFLLLNRYSAWLRTHILFAHFARWPLKSDFNDNKHVGIEGVKNFYLKSTDDVTLGLWQILPKSLICSEPYSDDYFDRVFGDGKPIIVYVHGNAGNRLTPHRVELYQKFQNMDFHTIAFDYRSYGDSTPVVPNELGVVADAKTVIKWVFEHNKTSKIYIWGHSLGTGVSSRAVKELEEVNLICEGLVLEAPFNNLFDELKSHPLLKPLKYMIGFNYFLVAPLAQSGTTFQTDHYLTSCSISILILHGEDDWIVPFSLGKKLYHHLLKTRKSGSNNNVKFVAFGTKNGGYGHKYLNRCPELMNILKLFMAKQYDEIPTKVD